MNSLERVLAVLRLERKLVAILVQYYRRMAQRGMEPGRDVFWSSDDYCDNRGPLSGASRCRGFVRPGLQTLVQSVVSEGFPFIKHCDGSVSDILADLVETRVACIDPTDVGAGMKLREVKAEAGTRAALKGGVSIRALARGRPRIFRSAYLRN